jgi:hypothetical protein
MPDFLKRVMGACRQYDAVTIKICFLFGRKKGLHAFEGFSSHSVRNRERMKQMFPSDSL